MAEVDKIVQVYITRETTQIETASFDIPLIVAQRPAASETGEDADRVTVHSDLESVATMFGLGSVHYQMASKLLGQQLRPREIIIGLVESDETYPQAIVEISKDNNEWLAVMIDDKTPSTIKEVAAYIQGVSKVFGASTSDTTIPTSEDTADLGSELLALGYDHTFWVYDPQAETNHPEAGWIGGQLPELPGSNTWSLKKAAGVATTKLDDTQLGYIRDKKGNFFHRVAGVNIFQDGVMADGEFIDNVIFVMWCEARIKEGIFGRMANKKKIPLTKAGAMLVENEIRSVLEQGVRQGGISEDYPIYVESPDPDLMPANQRAARIFGDFKFEFRLAGAAHSVVVRGVASV